MKYSVIKRSLDGLHVENLGELDLVALKALGKTFIPSVFKNVAEVDKAIRVIKVEGCDDWFIPGPAVISIRIIEE